MADPNEGWDLRAQPRRKGPDRLLILGDRDIGFASVLLDAFLAEIARRTDVELVAVCETGRRPAAAEPGRTLRQWARGAARAVFSPSTPRAKDLGFYGSRGVTVPGSSCRRTAT